MRQTELHQNKPRVDALYRSLRHVATSPQGEPAGAVAREPESPLEGVLDGPVEVNIPPAGEPGVIAEAVEEPLRVLYERERGLRQELEAEIKRRAEFTRALVHELKTPLTPVLASSDILLEELHEEPFLSLARNINQGASNLNNRIDELLDLSRGEIGMLRLNPRPVDPLGLLQQAGDHMAPVASRHGQSLILALPATLPLVWADEGRLRQVVLNLLGNASKFAPEGSEITLRAREEGDFLVVEVQDTGYGISPEEQQRLFEPYHRLERDRERLSGLGLGLALCKSLVELHGGRIWVESRVGAGSTFGFSVPLEASIQRPVGLEMGVES